MTLLEGRMEINGPASDLMNLARTAGVLMTCSARVSPSVRVRCPWDKRNPNRRELYYLHHLGGGNCATALAQIDALVNQSRLTPAEGEQAKQQIKELADLTKSTKDVTE